MKNWPWKKIAVVCILLYAVSFLERIAWNYSGAIQNERYEKEKTEYENTIQDLETKLYQHEINLIKSNAAVDGFSNEQLDSTWAAIFE